MTVSLDGYVSDPNGEIEWTAPDEELHRFHNEQTAELGAHLLGRRLYEVMSYWETTDPSAFGTDYEREFAEIWNRLPKTVFSTTLERVEGNATLARDDPAAEVARLKAEPGKDVGVGGAALAATLVRLGLVDEYRLFVRPVLVGGGTPFFPPLDAPQALELVETRTFGSKVVYLRYAAT
jgi:dihydrofolate reductase